MSVTIVGAGVSGLTLADHLTRCNIPVALLERANEVGGLCRSFTYGDATFDIGPHRLFSSHDKTHAFFLDILGTEYETIARSSQVRMDGRYLDWPLSLDAVFRLPLRMMLGCSRDLLFGGGKKRGEVRNLEDFVVARYGRTVYETFWRDYTRKFLGVPCSEVDSDWGQVSVGRSVVDRRVEPNGLLDLVKNCLKPSRTHLSFLYPTGGMGNFPKRLAGRIQARGAELRLGQEIEALHVEGDRVVGLTVCGNRRPVDDLVWTGSILDLSSLLGLPDPGLRYLSTLLFNVVVNEELPGDWQWIYYPDPDHIFARISRPDRFGRGLIPAGRTPLCVEVSCRQGDALWQRAGEIVPRVIDDLVKVGMMGSAGAVERYHVERIVNTYPICTTGYRRRLQSLWEALSRFRNLHVLGRQARFKHDNIDEAVEAAQAFAAAHYSAPMARSTVE